MARNPNTFSLGGPGGVMYMTHQEARRLVSAASQQLEANKRDNRGITLAELDLLEKIALFRRNFPGVL